MEQWAILNLESVIWTELGRAKPESDRPWPEVGLTY